MVLGGRFLFGLPVFLFLVLILEREALFQFPGTKKEPTFRLALSASLRFRSIRTDLLGEQTSRVGKSRFPVGVRLRLRQTE